MGNTRDRDDFQRFLTQRELASTAFVNGDFAPLDSVSTHIDPATIFAPMGTVVESADAVNSANADGARLFVPGSTNQFEILHMDADGDLAYWTGIQRSVLRMQGAGQPIPMDLRVTELFRRENGEWKLFHRHADLLKS